MSSIIDIPNYWIVLILVFGIVCLAHCITEKQEKEGINTFSISHFTIRFFVRFAFYFIAFYFIAGYALSTVGIQSDLPASLAAALLAHWLTLRLSSTQGSDVLSPPYQSVEHKIAWQMMVESARHRSRSAVGAASV